MLSSVLAASLASGRDQRVSLPYSPHGKDQRVSLSSVTPARDSPFDILMAYAKVLNMFCSICCYAQRF